MSQKNFWWTPLKINPLYLFFRSFNHSGQTENPSEKPNSILLTWLYKVWQTKICGLEGRVLFCWFEKEILHKELYKLFSGLVRNKLWNMIYKLLHELEVEHLQLVIQPLPQVSCHGAPNHVDGIQLQLWASVSLQSLHLSHYNGYPFWYRHMMQN